MNRLFLLSLGWVLILGYGCRATRQASDNQLISTQTVTTGYSTNFMEQSTWVLGYFSRDRMMLPPHSEWFTKGYDSYQPDPVFMKRLNDTAMEDLSIKVVLGTWCPDSRREVPRFMRIIDLWGFPVEKITFIGVDNEKIAPVGEYESLDIQRVPTFIFYKNNIEAGRIIEVPLTSLEQDMINILDKE